MEFFNKTEIMGVLNVTPNSFSDGGRYFSLQDAVEYANIRGGKLTLDFLEEIRLVKIREAISYESEE